MARKPMVTRTITVTNINLTTIDLSTLKAVKQPAKLPRTYKTEDEAMKVATKLFNNETTKVLAVELLETESAIYGMDEDKFVELATILPDRK